MLISSVKKCPMAWSHSNRSWFWLSIAKLEELTESDGLEIERGYGLFVTMKGCSCPKLPKDSSIFQYGHIQIILKWSILSQ